MTWSPITVVIAWVVGVVAGLDLVSVLQSLLSRPLVAGAAAGWLVGDPITGIRVGALLELFALDVVPVGSSRYPDFGAASVAAVLYAAGLGDGRATGAAVALGVALAVVAGGTLPVARRLTARVVHAYGARLAAGDDGAVRAVHLTGLAHDLARSAVVSIVAVAVALALRTIGAIPGTTLGATLNAVAVGGAAWAVAHGAMASARSGTRWRWAALGLVVGTIGIWLR